MAVPAFDHELEGRLERLHLLPADERIDALAQLIRASDDLLASLPPEPLAEASVPHTLRLLTRIVRAIAFQYMREVNPDQAWFWTEEWQAGEREVDANQAAGRGEFFENDETFDAHLRTLRPDLADVQQRSTL